MVALALLQDLLVTMDSGGHPWASLGHPLSSQPWLPGSVEATLRAGRAPSSAFLKCSQSCLLRQLKKALAFLGCDSQILNIKRGINFHSHSRQAGQPEHLLPSEISQHLRSLLTGALRTLRTAVSACSEKRCDRVLELCACNLK